MIKYHKRNDGLYVCDEAYWYYSPRYDKRVFIKQGQVRNGANWAVDIRSSSWWVHDQLCADTRFHDGTPCSAFMAASVLSDILQAEGRWARAVYWKWSTFLFGCKRTRANGWF